MNIHIMKDTDLIAREASRHFIEVLQTKENPVLGLATGSSPIGMYNYLIKAFENDEISFKDVTTFNLDEYVGIRYDHPQSYYTFMNEHLFKHVDIVNKNINLPKGDANAIADYQELLDANKRDIQILGIGSNGHIAFNEPGTSFDQTTFEVELDEGTREDNKRFFSDISEVPTHAITMGLKDVMNSEKIVLIAIGSSKAEAIYKMIKEDANPSLPASILKSHPNVEVYLDEEAASLLIN
ncbi:glucosamine-6-phosphate deaminase [Mollicutes bacterium LVI A0078]|nr:glucosamine-6-phosphate deaminase [Mollicutes bacterium LVI A0075]WOO91358.1 glucosamine-6-phosphate deaminase [Mollicutes bacterium LVI A0078]